MPQGVFVALRFATVLHMADTKAARREVGVGGIKRQQELAAGFPRAAVKPQPSHCHSLQNEKLDLDNLKGGFGSKILISVLILQLG